MVNYVSIQKYKSGFSLIELLVVLFIVAIMANAAAPGLVTWFDHYKSIVQLRNFVTDLNFARNEAVKRGQRVVIEKTGTDWQDGWQIFEDLPIDGIYNNSYDSTETMIKELAAISGIILTPDQHFTDFIRYNSSGKSNSYGSFELLSNHNQEKKVVCISKTGRSKLSRCPDEDDPRLSKYPHFR